MNATDARSLLSRHGTCRPQPASDWRGDFPLPGQLAAFYQDVGPDDISIDTGANPVFLPSLSNLWERQAGYRWNALTGQPIANWNPEWIVVADEGADPYVFYRGSILSASHGSGVWDFHGAFPNLVTMACSLATKSYDDDDEEEEEEEEESGDED
ncbi:MAG: hypothetical protein V4726_13080 [Verrucomicrobiota bacterium]